MLCFKVLMWICKRFFCFNDELKRKMKRVHHAGCDIQVSNCEFFPHENIFTIIGAIICGSFDGGALAIELNVHLNDNE